VRNAQSKQQARGLHLGSDRAPPGVTDDGLAAIDLVPWHEPDALQRVLVTMLQRTNVAPRDLIAAWDANGDGAFKLRDFEGMVKSLLRPVEEGPRSVWHLAARHALQRAFVQLRQHRPCGEIRDHHVEGSALVEWLNCGFHRRFLKPGAPIPLELPQGRSRLLSSSSGNAKGLLTQQPAVAPSPHQQHHLRPSCDQPLQHSLSTVARPQSSPAEWAGTPPRGLYDDTRPQTQPRPRPASTMSRFVRSHSYGGGLTQQRPTITPMQRYRRAQAAREAAMAQRRGPVSVRASTSSPVAAETVLLGSSGSTPSLEVAMSMASLYREMR